MVERFGQVRGIPDANYRLLSNRMRAKGTSSAAPDPRSNEIQAGEGAQPSQFPDDNPTVHRTASRLVPNTRPYDENGQRSGTPSDLSTTLRALARLLAHQAATEFVAKREKDRNQ